MIILFNDTFRLHVLQCRMSDTEWWTG